MLFSWITLGIKSDIFATTAYADADGTLCSKQYRFGMSTGWRSGGPLHTLRLRSAIRRFQEKRKPSRSPPACS